jgi:serine/threonine protein kinase
LDHHQEGCLKELKEELRSLRDSVVHFRQEAAVAADLRHPNIVGLLDADLDKHYLVFELVDGCDLHRLHEVAGGKLSAPQAIRIASELLRALSWSHSLTRADAAAGVLHRDLSPKNVLISHAGDVKLMDFGCAGRIREPASILRGTGPYMSPEQIRAGVLDGRSDLFSLGVILFELVTGKHPYDTGSTGSTFARIAEGAHTPVLELEPSTPPELAAFIARLLRPNPDERFASADAAFETLAAIAPSPLVTRELGTLAHQAYRRQTKDYGALKAQRMSSRPATSNPLPPAALPPPTRHIGRRWALSGLGIAAALTLALATRLIDWPERAAPAAVEAQPAASTPQPTTAPGPAPEATSPSPAPAATPATSSPSQPREPTQPSESPPSLTATSIIAAPPQEPGSRSRPTRTPQPATLHINAAPPSQIWIDGRSYGQSTVHAQLAAGKHIVEAGKDHPETKRTVRLRANEEHDEFFDLTQPK